jgi:hypothetical protein
MITSVCLLYALSCVISDLALGQIRSKKVFIQSSVVKIEQWGLFIYIQE